MQCEKDVGAISLHLREFYEFVLQRDGCPKIVNLGCAKTDMFYERKKHAKS